MKKILLITLTLIVMTAFVSADATFIGSKKCRMCHKGEKKGNVFEKWEAGVHAKAFELLKKSGDEKNPECLACHTTAFNKGGYKVGAENAADFAGVGCESCHGPGSDYKKMSVMKDLNLSKQNGLIVPSEAVCKKCHNEKSKDFKGFNYAEYAKKIDHTFKK